MVNEMLKRIRNYITGNKKMFMKIFMESNISITITEDTDTRKNYILNFLNSHETKSNNFCSNLYKLAIYPNLMNLKTTNKYLIIHLSINRNKLTKF